MLLEILQNGYKSTQIKCSYVNLRLLLLEEMEDARFKGGYVFFVKKSYLIFISNRGTLFHW